MTGQVRLLVAVAAGAVAGSWIGRELAARREFAVMRRDRAYLAEFNLRVSTGVKAGARGPVGEQLLQVLDELKRDRITCSREIHDFLERQISQNVRGLEDWQMFGGGRPAHQYFGLTEMMLRAAQVIRAIDPVGPE